MTEVTIPQVPPRAWKASQRAGTRRLRGGPSFLEERLERIRDESPCVSRCTFCPWFFQGTVAQCRDAARLHRAAARHPLPARRGSAGDVDSNGDIVDVLRQRVRKAIPPIESRSVDVAVDDQVDLVLGLLSEAKARGAQA